LHLRQLLDGMRGKSATDVDSFCDIASRFSVMVYALRDVLSEIDINPVVVSEAGAIAVDAFVAGRDRREEDRAKT